MDQPRLVYYLPVSTVREPLHAWAEEAKTPIKMERTQLEHQGSIRLPALCIYYGEGWVGLEDAAAYDDTEEELALVHENKILKATAEREGAQAALTMYEGWEVRDVVGLGTVVQALGQERMFEELLRLLEPTSAGPIPNVPVYNSALYQFGRARRFRAFQRHFNADSRHVNVILTLTRALLTAFYTEGSVTWSIFLVGCRRWVCRRTPRPTTP